MVMPFAILVRRQLKPNLDLWVECRTAGPLEVLARLECELVCCIGFESM